MDKLCGVAVKRPIHVYWFKWKGWSEVNIKELQAWIEAFDTKFEDIIINNNPKELRILTLEGSSYDLPDGYIIIRGIEGEFYPCEPEIFNKTYNII